MKKKLAGSANRRCLKYSLNRAMRYVGCKAWIDHWRPGKPQLCSSTWPLDELLDVHFVFICNLDKFSQPSSASYHKLCSARRVFPSPTRSEDLPRVKVLAKTRNQTSSVWTANWKSWLQSVSVAKNCEEWSPRRKSLTPQSLSFVSKSRLTAVMTERALSQGQAAEIYRIFAKSSRRDTSRQSAQLWNS